MEEKIFLAFAPHRDCGKGVEIVKRSLFSRGFYGAFSFPTASPLAVLARALTKDELKRIAAQLRENTFVDGKKGRITAGEWGTTALGGIFFGGQRLDVPVERLFQAGAALPRGVVVEAGAVPLLVEAIMRGDTPGATEDDSALMEAAEKKTRIVMQLAPFSFTAGYVANLALRPLCSDGYSFEWRIGELVWMPKMPRLSAENDRKAPVSINSGAPDLNKE
ncbi:MAG: hypothetical protein LBL45_07610 [Treponema sp.]|jgi:hypothetical protein|nr:hypothetical protein [Treponema sp.]